MYALNKLIHVILSHFFEFCTHQLTSHIIEKMNATMTTIVSDAVHYLDYAQCKKLAHTCATFRDIVMKQGPPSNSETIYEAVERAARQSRASLLSSSTTILAQYPSIRNIAILFALIHDDIESLRASCLSVECARNFIATNRAINPYRTSPTCRCSLLLYAYLFGDDYRRCFHHAQSWTIAQRSTDGAFTYVPNNGSIVYGANPSMITDIVEYVSAIDSIYVANMCDMSRIVYALMCITSDPRAIADVAHYKEWVIHFAKTQKFLPTTDDDAREMSEILAHLPHDRIIKELCEYFISPLFVPERFYLMLSILDKRKYDATPIYSRVLAMSEFQHYLINRQTMPSTCSATRLWMREINESVLATSEVDARALVDVINHRCFDFHISAIIWVILAHAPLCLLSYDEMLLAIIHTGRASVFKRVIPYWREHHRSLPVIRPGSDIPIVMENTYDTDDGYDYDEHPSILDEQLYEFWITHASTRWSIVQFMADLML